MTFESEIASWNEYYFFKEFTYSKTTFRPKPTDEVQLADNVIWLGDHLFLYQVKEREEVKTPSSQGERKWFEKKVLGLATRQIRDSLTYLKTHKEIQIENHRGHAFKLQLDLIRSVQKLVIYLPRQLLPMDCRSQKHHRSRSVGIIHLLAADDYRGVIRTLLTPAEFADYLAFRESLIESWESDLVLLPEQALLGQYLSGAFDDRPSFSYTEYLTALEHRADEWDMSGVLNVFAERVSSTNFLTEYYPIVREIALLKRGELREFKKRFRHAMEKAKANKFAKPFRIALPRTGCGFVFIPLTRDFLSHRQQGLRNLTIAHKYDQRLSKCIGVSFAFEGDGMYSEEWCYDEFPWAEDRAMEQMLQQNNPFREVKEAELPRYHFRQRGS